LRTFERQEEHGFQEIDLQHIYRAMDAIEDLDSKIKSKLSMLFPRFQGKLSTASFLMLPPSIFESNDISKYSFLPPLNEPILVEDRIRFFGCALEPFAGIH
jgi:hypothetical protein